MKKRNAGLLLLLAAMCLGACGPKAGGENAGAGEITGAEGENAGMRGENDGAGGGNAEAGENPGAGENAGAGDTTGKGGTPSGTEEGAGESGSGEAGEAAPGGAPGTGKEPGLLALMTASEYDNVWGEDRCLCYINYSKVWLDSREDADVDTGAAAFPQLAQVLEEMNAETDKTAKETMTELEATARELESYGSAQELSWEEDTWVVRSDSQVLSLLKRNYTYTGGAHGDYGYTGLNFDSESGRQLELGEVVTDPGQLIELAAGRLAEKYPDIEFFEEPGQVMERELEEGYLTWAAGYQGITFYFDPYELAPYGYGALTVTVLYEENPELFDAKIRQVPGSWAVRLAPGMEFDLGHDGTLDQIEVSGTMDEYGNAYEKLQVAVNGQEAVEDLWFYRYDSYVVHKEDLDTELLVTQTTSDNDYQLMLVHELDPDREGFHTPWRFSSTGPFSYYEDLEDGTWDYGTLLLTNPEHFCLTVRFDLLSTYSGSQWCRFDREARADGYLVLEHPWYDVDRGDWYLTLLVPLEMETGETREPQVYPAGTKLWIVRVEGEDCVVFTTEDDTVCRVYVESSEWPGRVRGVEDMTIDEIFDGMMFAG